MNKETRASDKNNLKSNMKHRISKCVQRQTTLYNFFKVPTANESQNLIELKPSLKIIEDSKCCIKESIRDNHQNDDSMDNEKMMSHISIKMEAPDEVPEMDIDYESSNYFICENNAPSSEIPIKLEDNVRSSTLMDEQSYTSNENEPKRFHPVTPEKMKEQIPHFYCNDCDYKSKRKNILLMHIKKVHTEEFKENLSNCLKCGKHFKSVMNKNKHESLCGRFNYICSFCSKETRFAHMMKDHLLSKHDKQVKGGKFDVIYKAILNQRKEQRSKMKKQMTIEQNAAVKVEDTKSNTKDLIKLHCETCNTTFDRIRYKNKVINKCPDCGTFLRTKCAKCKKIFSSEYIHKHLRIVCDVKQYLKCKYCEYIATWSHHMKCHVKNNHSGLPKSRYNTKSLSKKFYTCERCDFKTRYKYNFQAHVVSEHRETKKKVHQTTSTQEIVPKVECSVNKYAELAKVADTKPVYNSSKPIKTWKFFYCKECNYTSASKEAVRSHVLNKHSKEFDEDGMAKCPTCGKLFQRLHALKKHKLMCGLISYKCEYCSESWCNSHSIERHLKVKHKLEQEKLEEAYNDILRKARELRDDVRKSIADQTQTTFRITNDMIKLYCEKCDKAFDRIRERGNSFLKNCPVCETFLQSKCSKCGKLSPTARLIWTHVVSCFQRRNKHMHLDLETNDDLQQKNTWSEVMYYCNDCDFSAKVKTELRWHIRSKHMSEYLKLYECKICPFKSPYSVSFKHHKRVSHRISLKIINK